jgi:hypothetical protein
MMHDGEDWKGLTLSYTIFPGSIFVNDENRNQCINASLFGFRNEEARMLGFPPTPSHGSDHKGHRVYAWQQFRNKSRGRWAIRTGCTARRGGDEKSD